MGSADSLFFPRLLGGGGGPSQVIVKEGRSNSGMTMLSRERSSSSEVEYAEKLFINLWNNIESVQRCDLRGL